MIEYRDKRVENIYRLIFTICIQPLYGPRHVKVAAIFQLYHML